MKYFFVLFFFFCFMVFSQKKCEKAIEKVRASVNKGDVERYKQIEEKYLRNTRAALEAPGGYLG